MMSRPYLLHALSPLHAGVGQAQELIDLPIARLKGSGIPFVPGSSVKGVLRDAHDARDADIVEAIYGPDQENADKFMGALICTDARLLALPVRSFFGTFAYVTSPLLLTLAARDLDKPTPVPAVSPPVVPGQPPGCMAVRGLLTGGSAGATVYLEDLDLAHRQPDAGFTQWQTLIANALGTVAADIFRNRFAVVDDEVMTFLWESATQLDQRVRIDEKTRTVAEGALWLEESLPPETLMIGLLLGEQSRNPKKTIGGAAVLDAVLKDPRTLQFGGKSTVGRGRCRMVKL